MYIHVYIYIYIYIHTYDVHTLCDVCISLSLSLYIYIYIYIYDSNSGFPNTLARLPAAADGLDLQGGRLQLGHVRALEAGESPNIL